MTRPEALQALQQYTQSLNLIRHHLAVEAAMRALCKVISGRTHTFNNEELWAVTGLLHDADYESTRNNPEQHTLELELKLGAALPKEVMHAIKAHNYKVTKVTPTSAMDWALYTCDDLTGFVIATMLELKEKQLSKITINSIMQKLQDTTFAPSVDRAQIMSCEKGLQLPTAQFVGIVLGAMQGIATDLGFEA